MFRKMFGKDKSKGEGSSQEIKYKGVDKRSDKYEARTYGVEEKGKRSSLGTFDTPEEAAAAYDYAVRSVYGANAYTNFVYPDGKQSGSLTNIIAPEEPEYELSPDHSAAAAGDYNSAGGGYKYDTAGGYNYDAGGYNSGNQQSYFGQVDYQPNSGFGQVDYPPWVPGDELPPLPGSSFSGGYGNGNGSY